MLTRSMGLLAMCCLAGCGGGNALMIAFIVAFVIAASIRNGISLSQTKCRYCGHSGTTPTYHEKGFVDYVTCDHCGKQL